MEDTFEVIDRRTRDGEKPVEESPEVIDLETPELSCKDSEEPKEEPKKIVLAELDRNYDDPQPIFNYLLVRQNAAETTWNGTHFIIPDSIRQSPNEGVVVAIAEFYIVDGKEFPMIDKVAPGDIVKFSKYNAEPLKCDDEDFVLVSIFDVKFRRKVSYGISSAVRS